METIEMSTRERRRMGLMTRVTERLLKLRAAAEMMRVSYRQAKRIWRRYREEGDAGLVHRGRGRRSSRSRPVAERKRAVALYSKKYKGFGPLLASEHLAEDHNLVVDHETLRRWLVSAGLWETRRRRESHRAARERRPRRGDLVQIDGSEHDWFEGRGARAVLMVMIDDATNRTLARFYAAEDTAAAYDIFDRYVCQYGLPTALYPDRDSIYVCTREASLEEELANVGPETQFTRAMRELGVELIPAYSPQAKGRVERRHGLFQDRLVKEMRLLGIHTLEAANAYLDGTFLALVNTRYTVTARDSANGHQARPSATTLALVLSWQEPRCVAKDWTLRWRNRRLQIDARHAALGLPGRHVVVVERRDGTLAMLYGKRLLTFRDAPALAAPVPRPVAPQNPCRPRQPPAADHPWRRQTLVHRPVFRSTPMDSMTYSRGEKKRTYATADRMALTS
ncbi:MAG: ISNCY family transposase [bacterium]